MATSATNSSKRLALIAFALVLSGCAGSTYGDYFQAIRSTFSNGLWSQQVTREQAAAIPYASLGYRVDKSGERILVLATDGNGAQIWTSASHVVLNIEDGRVTHSVALPHDLSALAPKGSNRLLPLSAALIAPYTSMRIADFADIGEYSVLLTCRTFVRSHETIMILGTAIATNRVDESCSSHHPDWSFINSYWLDALTGQVWRSRQNLHPSGETIEIEILRSPS